MWANTMANGRHNYYRCASRIRGHECSSRSAGVRAESAEAYVDELFAHWQQPADWAERLVEPIEPPAPGSNVQAERRRLEDKLGRLRRGLVDGLLDYPEAARQIEAAELELRQLPRLESGRPAGVAIGGGGAGAVTPGGGEPAGAVTLGGGEPAGAVTLGGGEPTGAVTPGGPWLGHAHQRTNGRPTTTKGRQPTEPPTTTEGLPPTKPPSTANSVDPAELTDIRDLWPRMTIEERREFLSHVLDGVCIDSADGGVVGVLPALEFLPLFELVAEGEAGRLEVVTWRPRSDSNRRSPP